jgi:serine/threonine-protein kinase
MSNEPAPTNPILPGQILAGKYRVERIVGQGGMGVVVEARHVTLDERVALKFLLPGYATQPDASPRFLREAKAAVKIKSEHVARVADVGTLETGAPFMVMEFLDGTDLSNKLSKEGVLAVEDAVDYVIQGCDALAEAHGYGIVHRDIKPANLFLTRRPNGMPLVKVLDFGISKTTGPQVDSLTKTSTAMGSALYMSPEQMQQARGVDHRTDIYALGVTLYQLLAGRQPFYADTLPELCAAVFTGTPTPLGSLRPDVPPGLAAVLEKAYARDRGARYQSIGEFVVALAPYAPRRSQPVVESVAKMSGLETPVATDQLRSASPGAPASPPAAGIPRTLASAGVAVSGGPPLVAAPPQAPYGPTPVTVTPAHPDASKPPGAVLGGLPQTTGPGVSMGAPVPVPASSKGAWIALASVLVLSLAGVGAYFAWRTASTHVASPAEASAPLPADTPTTLPVTTATAVPAVTATAAPTPAVTAGPVPSASSAAPAATVASGPKALRPPAAFPRPAPLPAAPPAPAKPTPRPLPSDPAGF